MSEGKSYSRKYKLGWLAIRSHDIEEIIKSLKLNDPQESTLEDGVNAVYNDLESEAPKLCVYISPPIDGWIMIICPGIFGDKENATAINDILLPEIASRFEELQSFSYDPENEYTHWILYKNSLLERAFAYCNKDRELISDIGNHTLAEKVCEFEKIKTFEWIPDDETIYMISHQWSINPASIDLGMISKKGYLAQYSEFELERIYEKFEEKHLKKNKNEIIEIQPLNQQCIKYYKRWTSLGYMGGFGYFNLGIINSISGNNEDASKNLKKSIELTPEHPYAYYLLAQIYDQEGVSNTEIDRKRKIMSQEARDGVVNYISAFENYIKGNREATDLDLRRAIAFNSRDPYAYLFLTENCLEIKNYSRAKAYLEKVLFLGYNDEFVYNLQANVLYKLGEFKAGQFANNNILKINPDSALYYLNEAALYQMQGLHDLVIDNANKAISLKPDFPESYAMLGMAYISKNEKEKGLELIYKAIDLDPGCYLALTNKIINSFTSNNYQEAEEFARKNVYYNPHKDGSYTLLGIMALFNNKIDLALSSFKAATVIHAGDSELFSYVGLIYCIKNECEKAERYLKKALELNSKCEISPEVLMAIKTKKQIECSEILKNGVMKILRKL
ncbi:MAG: hypothetical protein AB1782_20205 [Cyanobacteriota bacterium]